MAAMDCSSCAGWRACVCCYACALHVLRTCKNACSQRADVQCDVCKLCMCSICSVCIRIPEVRNGVKTAVRRYENQRRIYLLCCFCAYVFLCSDVRRMYSISMFYMQIMHVLNLLCLHTYSGGAERSVYQRLTDFAGRRMHRGASLPVAVVFLLGSGRNALRVGGLQALRVRFMHVEQTEQMQHVHTRVCM